MKKLICFIIMSMFLLTLVSALELNPFTEKLSVEKVISEDTADFLKIDFNEKYGVIKLSETFLWVETDKIAEYSLTKNTEQCLIDCEAKGKAILYQEGRLFDETNFVNRFGKEKIIEYQFYIKVNKSSTYQIPDTYKTICEEIKTNTTTKTLIEDLEIKENCYEVVDTYKDETTYYTEWEKYNFEELLAGNYEWKIEGKKGLLESIDFIPVSNGKELDEWAWWDSSWSYKQELTNLTSNNIIRINVTYNAHMQTDFEDVRFTNSTESAELGYWLESKVNGVSAIYRIKTNGESSIYMYYGNALATSGSDSGDIYGSALVNFWNFGEGSGTNAIDRRGAEIGNQRNMTITNAVYRNGLFDKSLYFDGTAYTETSSSISSLVGTGNFMINVWVNRTYAANGNMFSIKDGTTSYRAISQTAGNMRIFWAGGDTGAIGSGISMTGTEWNMVTFGRKSGRILTYLNGVLLSNISGSGSAPNNVFALGKDGTGGDLITGELDEVMVFSSSLNLSQILSINSTKQNYAVFGTEETNTGVSIAYLTPPTLEDGILWNQTYIPVKVNVTTINATISNITYRAYKGGVLNQTLFFTNETYYINFTNCLCDTWTYNVTICAISDIGGLTICDSTPTRTVYIDILPPEINVTSPTGVYDYIYDTYKFDLNWSVNDVAGHLDSCWYEYPESENMPYNLFDKDTSTTTNWNINGYVDISELTTELIFSTNAFISGVANNSINISDCESNIVYINNRSDSNFYYLDFYCDGNVIKTVSASIFSTDPKSPSEIWANQTIYYVNCSQNSTFNYFKNINTLTFYANDTFGNINSEEINWGYIIFENSNIFTEQTLSGGLESFSLNITFNDSYDFSSANFIYNNTESTTSISSYDTDVLINVTNYFVPSVTTPTNFSFYYNIIVDSLEINSSINNQSVYPVLFDNCSSYNYTLVNLSLYDERLQTSLIGDIEVNYELLNVPLYDVINSFSINFENVSNALICSDTNLSDINVLQSIEIRYQGQGTNLSYVPELYHVQRAEIDNEPLTISLYDLNSTYSTEFKLTYQDSTFNFVSDAIIQLQRKYISEGIYRTVEAPLTSSGGVSLVHVDLNSIKYMVTVVKNGEVLDIFDNVVFDCESELTGECTQKLLGDIDPQNDINFESTLDFVYTEPVLTNDSITVSFSVPSGDSASVLISLVQKDSFGNITLANRTIVSTAGSISVDYEETLGQSYIDFSIYKDGEPIAHKSYIVEKETGLDWLGNNYIFIFIIMLSLVGMALSSPEWIIINAILTMVISGGLYLANGLNFVTGLGSIMWLIIGAIILISKISQQEDR